MRIESKMNGGADSIGISESIFPDSGREAHSSWKRCLAVVS
jgi:hypothetical protein